MTNRFPLIVDSISQTIKELPIGDNLDLTGSGINGGTIDGTVIGGSTPAAISGTTGTFSGNLTVDTNTLFVDAANNRVGIGTSSPQKSLVVSDGGAMGIELSPDDAGQGYSRILNFDRTTSQYEPLYIEGEDLRFSTGTSAVERMRITSSGNVGIGTSSPSFALDVVGANDTTFDGVGTIRLSGTNAYNSGDAGSGITFAGIFNSSNGETTFAQISGKKANTTDGNYDGVLTFGVRNTLEGVNIERMRINESGNLLVGTTASEGSAKVAVVSTTASGAIACRNSTGTGSTLISFISSSGSSFIGSISNANDTAVSYNTTSDYRLKEDVQPMVGATDRLMALKPVNFAWKANGTRVDGFIAHEAQEVVPEAVTGEKDAVDSDGKPEYQGIDQSKIVPLLTAALQEALKRIEALEAQLNP